MTPEEQERAVAEIESGLDRLQALYNQYFMGIEKLEPTVQRKALDRKIHALRRVKLKNTVLRFRFQTQVQKYNTQSTYWRRICRQIEEGTYKRHIMRAKQRQERQSATQMPSTSIDAPIEPEVNIPAAPEPQKPLWELDEKMFHELSLDDPFSDEPQPQGDLKSRISALDDPFGPDEIFPQSNKPISTPNVPRSETVAARLTNAEIPPIPPTTPERLPQQQPPSHRPMKTGQRHGTKIAEASSNQSKNKNRTSTKTGVEPLDDKRIAALYRTYLAARKKCNEPTTKITLDKVARTLRAQYVAKKGQIDFKIVIRNGKAMIKSVNRT